MKVQEFIDYMKKNVNRTMKQDQVISMVQKVSAIKKYIGIKEKKKLIEDIVSECLYYDDGVYKFDNIDKYVYFTMYTVAAYTNLEFDNIFEDFDALSNTDLLPIIVEAIGSDYESVNIFLNFRCDDIMSENYMQHHFTKLMAKIGDAVDDISSKIGANMDGLDVGKLMEFMQKIK